MPFDTLFRFCTFRTWLTGAKQATSRRKAVASVSDVATTLMAIRSLPVGSSPSPLPPKLDRALTVSRIAATGGHSYR